MASTTFYIGADGSSSIAITSILQKMSNGTSFSFVGKNSEEQEISIVTIPNASTSVAGLVTNGDQTFAGVKTFDPPSTITANNITTKFKSSLGGSVIIGMTDNDTTSIKLNHVDGTDRLILRTSGAAGAAVMDMPEENSFFCMDFGPNDTRTRFEANQITCANFIGNASTATALTTNAGSNKQPIYFSGGKPVACSYKLDANIHNYYGSLASGGWANMNGKANSPSIAISYNNKAASWNSETYSATMVFGCGDTRGMLDCGYSNSTVTFGGSSFADATNDAPKWYFKIKGNSGTTYDLSTFITTSTADGRYVNITGDSMTGALRVAGNYTSGATALYSNASGLEIRECGRCTTSQSTYQYAPRLGFHWSGRTQMSIALHSNGYLYFSQSDDYTSSKGTIVANLNGNAATASSLTPVTEVNLGQQAATGWKRIAYYATSDFRGLVRIHLYGAGGNVAPYSLNILLHRSWSNGQNFIKMEGYSPYIKGARLTTDGTYFFVEINITQTWFAQGAQICGRDEWSRDLSSSFSLYSGELPTGGGTVVSTLNNTSFTYGLMLSGTIIADSVKGAVWNDYAEYRNTVEPNTPGYCVVENGDDTLSLSSYRMQKGAMIISDTFGFSIGETDECKTPIAVSGRVLAYTNEPRDKYRKHIGDCVCAGPGGKICIMSDEEAQKCPAAILGTISAVPEYETWGSGNVAVDGRVWIKVR